MTKTFCDICGEELSRENGTTEPAFSKLFFLVAGKQFRLEYSDKFGDADICKYCVVKELSEKGMNPDFWQHL